MTLRTLIVLAQFVAALGVFFSVVYLAIQVRQNAKITKAQFGHSLTSRLYERYFLAAKDQEFSRFLAKNWSTDKLEDYEYWRITLWINTCLVDIFDTYDQHKHGLVDITNLNMRINLLQAEWADQPGSSKKSTEARNSSNGSRPRFMEACSRIQIQKGLRGRIST